MDKRDGGVAERDPVRDAAGDRVIAGVKCRCYRLKQNELNITAMWIDDANRLRGFNSWAVSHENETELSYDEDPPAWLFSTAWPKDAQVIDADTYLAEKFPVEKALFTKEAAGLVFAVHECKVDERGCYYVICSTRPGKGVDQTLGKTKGYMGNVSISGGLRLGNGRLEPLGYAEHQIAYLQNVYGWVQVRWFVMMPDLASPDLHGKLRFAATVSAINGVAAWRKGKGLSVSEEFAVELDGQKATNAAADFARGVWIDGEHLWPAIDGKLWDAGTGGPSCRPGEIPQADYVRNVQQRIDGFLNRPNPSPRQMK